MAFLNFKVFSLKNRGKGNLSNIVTSEIELLSQYFEDDNYLQAGDDVSLLFNDANYISEAPDDGSQYVRKNESWDKLTTYSAVDPISTNNVAGGYPLGSDWYNTATGEKFYQKANGVWISYTSSVTPPTPGGDSPVMFADYATSNELPSSTYYNGPLDDGIGATITAATNSKLKGIVGGAQAPMLVGMTLLVKDENIGDFESGTPSNRPHNGVYIVTQEGCSLSDYLSGCTPAPWVLTRVDYANEPGELYPSQVNILSGVNENRFFLQQNNIDVIGDTEVVYEINYVPPTQVVTMPLVHMDTVTSAPLPSCTYMDEFPPPTPGIFTLNPTTSYLTATVNGPLGVINGVNVSNSFTDPNRKILVKDQADNKQNGDYEIVQNGSATQPWKLRRITTTYSSLNKNTREWKINNEACTLYGNRYYMNYYTPSISIIGTTPITFSELVAGGIQNLQDVTDIGNTTTNNVQFGTGAGVFMNNGSRLKEGTIDAGYGGSKGIAQICAVGYELKWEAGRLYVMGDGGTTIREVSHNFTTIPNNYNDISQGFIVGSRWLLDDGTLYICTDNTDDAAVWVLQIAGTQDLQSVTDIGATTTNTITVGDIAGNFSQVLNSAVGTQDAVAGTYAYLDASGQLGLHNGDFESDLKNTNVTNAGVVLEFPNKTTGSYTIATIGDIPVISTPSLQAVTNVGNTTSDVVISESGFETTFLGINNNQMAFMGVSSLNQGGIITFKGLLSLQEGSLDGTGSMAHLTPTSLSQDRFLRLPDKDGTLAVTTDIPAAQVNSNWNATSGVAQILNKPLIPVVDSVPTYGSPNAAMSGGVFDALALKADLVAGKVPSTQLPSYVDDVIEGYYSAPTFYSNAGLTTPIVPETGKIYVDLLANKSYRWSGSVYIQISNAISSIDELTDVTIVSPLNGQLLQYNLTTSQWENKTVTVGNGDMQKSTYDIDNDGIVDFAETVPVTVRNPSVSDILRKGTIVYLSGSTGYRPNAYKAQANAESTSSGTFGVVLSDISTNSDGTIATLGTVHTLDTRNAATGATYPFTNDILADGDVLWLDPNNAGYVTKTKPQAPNHIVFIGVVARTHPSLGRIIYRITNGFELDELHNVFINGTLANKHTLYYDAATSLWKTNTIAGTLGYTPQELLSSGVNIKTISGNNLLGSGNIDTYLSSNIDTNISTPADGEVLTWNAAINKWISLPPQISSNGNNQLLTGGASWSGTGMVYNVTALTYIIDGINYGPTTPANVTLSNGDPSFSRFDAIVVDVTGIPSVIVGAASSNPTTPIISENDVLVQYVLVGAAATVPTITNEFVYRDGSAPDWTSVVATGTAPLLSASFVSTTPTPFQGSQCTLVNAPSYTSSKYIQYTKPSGNILRSTFSFLTFRVNLPVALPSRNVYVYLYNGTTLIGAQYATNWGLNLTSVNNWQLVSIPTSIFGNASITTVTRVIFRFTGIALDTYSLGYDQFAIDDVKFQSGYGPQANTANIVIASNNIVTGSAPKLNFINGTDIDTSSTYDNLNNKIDIRTDASINVTNATKLTLMYNT